MLYLLYTLLFLLQLKWVSSHGPSVRLLTLHRVRALGDLRLTHA